MSIVLKWLATHVITAILWVFVLAINFEGRTLFSYAHEYVIQSEYVQKADENLEELWNKAYRTARLTFAKLSSSSEDDETL